MLKSFSVILCYAGFEHSDWLKIFSSQSTCLKKAECKLSAVKYLKDIVQGLKLFSIDRRISGPLHVRPTEYVQEDDIFRMIRTIIADYDHTGLQFPIQKFILGEKALQVLS